MVPALVVPVCVVSDCVVPAPVVPALVVPDCVEAPSVVLNALMFVWSAAQLAGVPAIAGQASLSTPGAARNSAGTAGFDFWLVPKKE